MSLNLSQQGPSTQISLIFYEWIPINGTGLVLNPKYDKMGPQFGTTVFSYFTLINPTPPPMKDSFELKFCCFEVLLDPRTVEPMQHSLQYSYHEAL